MVVWLAGLEGALGVVCQTFDVELSAATLLDSDGLLRVVRCGLTLAGAALELGSIWLLAFLTVDLGCALMAKVAVGLCFSSFAQLLKLLVTSLLLLRLISASGPTQARLGMILREPLLVPRETQTIGVDRVR